MRNLWGAVDLSNTNNSRASNGLLDFIVLQDNDIRDIGNNASVTQGYKNAERPVWSYASDRTTWRRNYMERMVLGAGGLFTWPDTLAKPKIYDNQFPSVPELPSGGGGWQTNNVET